MEIISTKLNGILAITLKGRLDSVTSPELEKQLYLGDVDGLVFDFEELDYVSSAGLRLLLLCQKQMNGKGKMVVKNVKPEIMDVFELTGFDNILTIE